MSTKIEWVRNLDGTLGETWNPVTGCTKISAGCAHCYAERMSKRLAGRCGYPKDNPFKVTLHPENLGEPSRWKKPRRVFVNSMSDLFHEDVPFEFIEEIFVSLEAHTQHTFMILTKRPQRMLEFMKWYERSNTNDFMGWKWEPSANIWLGVSVENQAAADERIPLLLQIPAAVRFISAEPLLGPVDLTDIHYERVTAIDALNGFHGFPKPHAKGPKLDWVIVGGESGPRARPMHPDWVRSLRDQCQEAGTKFFFKQWGEWMPNAQEYNCNPGGNDFGQRHELVGDVAMCRVGKKKAGRVLDNKEWNEIPEVNHG